VALIKIVKRLLCCLLHINIKYYSNINILIKLVTDAKKTVGAGTNYTPYSEEDLKLRSRI
jgi:hypothetical protein